MSGKPKPSPECLIAEYIAAYKLANGKQPDFRVVYVAGWVQFRSRHSSLIIGRNRAGHMQTMTKRLLDKAATSKAAEQTQENAA